MRERERATKRGQRDAEGERRVAWRQSGAVREQRVRRKRQEEMTCERQRERERKKQAGKREKGTNAWRAGGISKASSGAPNKRKRPYLASGGSCHEKRSSAARDG